MGKSRGEETIILLLILGIGGWWLLTQGKGKNMFATSFGDLGGFGRNKQQQKQSDDKAGGGGGGGGGSPPTPSGGAGDDSLTKLQKELGAVPKHGGISSNERMPGWGTKASGAIDLPKAEKKDVNQPIIDAANGIWGTINNGIKNLFGSGGLKGGLEAPKLFVAPLATGDEEEDNVFFDTEKDTFQIAKNSNIKFSNF